MWRGKRRWSSTEVLLSVLCLTLLAVCVSLIIITWLAMQTDLDQCGLGGTESVFSGRLVITRGAVFTEKLRNRSSLQFKSLAFDTEHLISDAYSRGSLNNDFKACEVLEFSNGSVVVNFDLQFRQSVEVKEAEQQLVAGLQSTGGLVVNQNSIQVTGKCPPYHMACGNGTTCVATMQFCDGVDNCPDGSDENHTLCATKCDGQFLLLGPTGFFHSENFPLLYNNGMICRWVIRVQKGLAIKMNFHSFDTEEEIDTLSLYEGTGQGKNLTYLLSGRSPGTVWLLSDKATVEFSSDDYNNFQGFNATYSAEDISNLSNEERLSCSFEEGLCFWRQEPEDEGDWIRTNIPTFPPFTGPNFDHTFGNQSGYYIVTPGSPGQWEKNFKIRSLRLAHSKEPMCLKFWYHMYGENVHRLRVLVERRSTSVVREASVIVVFQKEGNYGDNWHFGQVTLNSTADATVVFEAQKKGGMKNDIALDDISLTNGPCGADPPDPTVVPTPTTPPPIPPDCGGPFDLWEHNSTFSSPNYPHSYGNKASCLWTLHAREGWNILLHFLDFDVESTYDMVEVRDGAGPQSELLGVFTGTDATFPDVISTANQITVMFFTDSTGYGRGFRANFTSGLALGMPKPCVTGLYRCQSGECISNVSVCNGQPDCADSSDEADCVHQVSVDSTSVRHLQLQVQTTRYTTCGQHWNSQLSHFMCRYLGYRSGSALLIPSTEKDSPFTTVSVAVNGTLDLTPRMEEKGEEESEESGTVRVVGGTDSRKGAWPWMVSLYFRGRHVCGATLIDNEWLVTAAHCVYGKNIHLSNWEAVLGLHSQGSVDVLPSQTRKVDHIIMNKHYNRRTKDADIAMMHLQTNVNFTDYIQPICLPASDQQFEAGRKCFIAGWGAEVEQGTAANVLQQAVLPLVSRSECQKLLPEYNITARMVCAGYSEGGVDSCQGDSGGPLMCEEDGHWVQVGVISFGVGCGRPQRPGVYALVSQFADWVVQTRRLS
ncbi:enteropeptidase [Salvelinus namaycush]|uniref:Enteropeptidase n=1 Tax=Salvelinus namaycush TaxID=8040 RepID=A0A8U1C6N1_SALNM|nr:enteropeptidase [Salvelinus namaycush]